MRSERSYGQEDGRSGGHGQIDSAKAPDQAFCLLQMC